MVQFVALYHIPQQSFDKDLDQGVINYALEIQRGLGKEKQICYGT